MSIEYRIGDVFDRLAEIPDGSVDFIVTSPPFLALRSYLPADHPDKHKEIGSEPTPAEFIDTLLALTAEWGRVLAPHGSLCVELGDTFAGDDRRRAEVVDAKTPHRQRGRPQSTRANVGNGWPLAKSLTGIPTLYPWSLAYGRNLLTGQPSPAGQWRIRNVIVWARPNPPVGALGDKFRPATSYITVACRGPKRYFDLDAVRTVNNADRMDEPSMHNGKSKASPSTHLTSAAGNGEWNPAGAPPLDWHTDNHPEDGDWLWKLSTQPYKGSHYATYPLTLPKRLIEAMCPLRVCMECGKASERITRLDGYTDHNGVLHPAGEKWPSGITEGRGAHADKPGSRTTTTTTTGWTDCGHDVWRTGVVLDPFAGSGTTLEAAQAVGRHAIGIDIDTRNADLAQQRVGMFLTVDGDAA